MSEKSPLPSRVQQKIFELQYQSELVVAAVQLAVITLFFIIFMITPIGYSPDAPIHSAVLGLSLFTILVLLRLYFAYTDRLNASMLGIFVIVEMALLIFIISTYHIQFETTSTIDLKNSHIHYIFVLIALRALRFEPIWVILSGITAMLGWSLLLWRTLQEAGMQTITWDYVTYASSRSIYPGAELDKILAIGLVTFMIAFALTRAKNTLREAVTKSIAAKDLSLFFDTEVVEKITQAEQALAAGQAETRQAAIMFIDMRGFSKLSEKLKSAELIQILSEYQQLLVPIIQSHQGNIDKFMGDGILASFGAVKPSKTYARDALLSVDEIFKAVEKWKKERRRKGEVVIEVGMGLSSGEVVFGMIGVGNRLEYTVIGETVNVAAKLEKHNKVEGAKALATFELLEEAMIQGYKSKRDKEIRHAREVAGIDERIDIVVLG